MVSFESMMSASYAGETALCVFIPGGEQTPKRPAEQIGAPAKRQKGPGVQRAAAEVMRSLFEEEMDAQRARVKTLEEELGRQESQLITTRQRLDEAEAKVKQADDSFQSNTLAHSIAQGCPICIDSMAQKGEATMIISLSCGHVMHAGCLMPVLDGIHSEIKRFEKHGGRLGMGSMSMEMCCPMCREAVSVPKDCEPFATKIRNIQRKFNWIRRHLNVFEGPLPNDICKCMAFTHGGSQCGRLYRKPMACGGDPPGTFHACDRCGADDESGMPMWCLPGTTAMCDNCETAVSRTGACSHMRCSGRYRNPQTGRMERCNEQFCWICMGSLNDRYFSNSQYYAASVKTIPYCGVPAPGVRNALGRPRRFGPCMCSERVALEGEIGMARFERRRICLAERRNAPASYIEGFVADGKGMRPFEGETP